MHLRAAMRCTRTPGFRSHIIAACGLLACSLSSAALGYPTLCSFFVQRDVEKDLFLTSRVAHRLNNPSIVSISPSETNHVCNDNRKAKTFQGDDAETGKRRRLENSGVQMLIFSVFSIFRVPVFKRANLFCFSTATVPFTILLVLFLTTIAP